MKIGSVLENQNLEKRVAITPEIVKKYTSLGFEIYLSANYSSHLGIDDKRYSDLGVKFLQDDNSGTVNVVTKVRNFPGDSLTTDSTSEVSSTTQKVNLRARGRQAVVRFESNDDATGNGNLSIGWRLGDTRMDVKTDGRR